MKKELPQDGRVRVNVALQVAGIATQVTAAMRSGSQERRAGLEARLAQAQSQLHPLEAPPGLIPFIDVMRGLLRGEDVSKRASGLPPAYRAVYEQVTASLQATQVATTNGQATQVATTNGQATQVAATNGQATQVATTNGPEEEEGELTVRQVMDEVAHNVIVTMRFGTPGQRQQMAAILARMEGESAQHPHLVALAHFCQAARTLLEGGDVSAIVPQLTGPFLARWEQIIGALETE